MHTSDRGEGELQRRLAALAPERQACFALACAERLVARTASRREEELRAVLELGWSALTDGCEKVVVARAEVDAREDLDDDEVAAVAYALDSVTGRAEGAHWAAVRALDAAFDRIPRQPDETVSRPLADDRAEPVVQEEMAWQRRALREVEGSAPLPDLIALLRST